MDCTSSHPRRRPQKASAAHPPSLPTSPHLRKVDTFHARSSRLSDMIDPVADHAYIPKRAPTSSKALEHLVAPRSHIAKLLADVDKTLAGLADATALRETEVWAVPQILLEHTAAAGGDCMDVDEKDVVVDHHHDSDSGLGSSVESGRSSISAVRSAVNSSFTAATEVDDRRPLSDFAAKEIKARILDPLLEEESLKPFHSLVADIPRRIGSKDIRNLRDLEKDLLLVSFDTAPSAQSYLRFCDKTITCIFATVGHLPEEDQRAPADRPFTNSYALDLVDQIRRYAQIMAETRAREQAGRPLGEMDYSPDEELTVEGGISHDGTPVHLVRKKNGKTIPVATEEEMEAISKASPLKRSFDGDFDDVDAMRSMARRRKSDRPGDVVHTCRDCKKEFKRPCDLTKHEKTHSRPWKCPDTGCKYHVDGWPTEKEMQRHFNDRHTTTPNMYHCQYENCTYQSKRESNCKQHMEKAHGYKYVRSKNTGSRSKQHGSSGASRTPSTPLTPSIITTPGSHFASTPSETFAPSPALANFPVPFQLPVLNPTPMTGAYDYEAEYRRQSVTTAGTAMTWSSSHSPFDHSSFDDAISPENLSFDPTMNSANATSDLFAVPSYPQQNTFQQQPTPAWSDNFNFNDPVPVVDSSVPQATGNQLHLSPVGQGDATLLSQDDMCFDEGLGGDSFLPTMTMGDFQLFDAPAPAPVDANNSLFADNMDLFTQTGTSSFLDDMSGYGNH